MSNFAHISGILNAFALLAFLLAGLSALVNAIHAIGGQAAGWIATLAILAAALLLAGLAFWFRKKGATGTRESLRDFPHKTALRSDLERGTFLQRSETTSVIRRRRKSDWRHLLEHVFGEHMDWATQERVKSELRVAREIQFSLAPRRFPAYSEWREFDLYSYLSPAREVGGDYYDFFMRDTNRIVFAVGDVSGKGVPAAMYMAVCRTAFRILARQAQQPGELLTRLNEMLIRENQSEMFITLACFFVDLPSGRCLYSLGGHPPPLLLRRRERAASFVDGPRETFVGLKTGVEYPVGELRLERGDTMLLYSDGVPDAHNGKGRDLGYGGLRDIFLANAEAESCKELVSGLEAGLDDFVGDNEHTDDVTMLAFRYWGPGGQKMGADGAPAENGKDKLDNNG